MAGLVYLFTSGTSWIVPAGVTGIQVECYGPGANISGSGAEITSLNSGGSYSKSNTISVTPGSTVYFNIGSSGGNTWFNTSNVAPTSSSSTSSACLAVGSSTASGSQIAANCGDVKYKGGNGYNSPTPSGGWGATGQGGQAGPNGNGADAGPAYYVASNGKLGSGGGANSGSQAAYNTIPYGRGGSTTVGRGGYVTSIYGAATVATAVEPTRDIVGAANFLNGTGSYLSASNNYGPYGGAYGWGYDVCCSCNLVTYYQINNYQTGFIVITLVTQTTKYIVVQPNPGTFNTYQTGSFTLPSDFGSLTSIEAFGAPGRGGNGGGGPGGGGYSKTLGSSITASLVAGSTVIYYQLAGNASSVTTSCGCFCSYSAGPVYPTWINIGTNSAPTSVTSGVLANGGQGYINQDLSSKAGATTTGAIGDTKYGGGAGGTCASSGSALTYAYGGGGGGGGPSGNGANAGNGASANGGGGGGASNGGNAGSAGTTTAGGAGGSITGGTGGSGATTSTASTAGTNGGGGGGGYSSGVKSPSAGGVLTLAANVYGLIGGGGGGYLPTGDGDNGGGGYNYTRATSIAGMIVFTYTPTATPTLVALTGSSSTASAGTLTPVPSFTQALTGSSATASAGTLTPVPSLFQALSGVSASASTGTLETSNDQIVNLNSASIAAYSGTLTNSQALEIALTGVSVDGQTSSFPANSDLVGAEAAGTTGSFDYRNTGWQPIDTAGTSNWTDIDTQI